MRIAISFLFLVFLSIANSFSQESTILRDSLKALQLIEKGKVLSEAQSYVEAFESVKKARDIFESCKLWDQTIWCEVQLAKEADNLDSPELKMVHADNALNLANRYLTQNNPILATAYRQKAEALMWVENLDSANYFLKLALPVFRSNENWVECGWTEVLLAVNNINTYKVDSCEYHLDKLTDLLANHTLPKTDLEELQSTLLDLRGVTYEFQGDFNKAIENLNEALNISLGNKNISALDSGFISNQFNSLGSIYMSKGDYLRAEDNFLQTIHYNKNASYDPILLNNIGQQYIKQEKHLKAISYFEKSAQLVGLHKSNSPQEKMSLIKSGLDAYNNLCFCYSALGRYEQALVQCKKAENQSLEYKKYITWATMGHIFIEQKKPEKAIAYLNKAIYDLALNAENFQDKILIKSKIFYLLGKAYLQNDNSEKGLSFFQRSLVTNHKNFKDSLNLESNPPLNGIYEPIYFLETISSKATTQATLAEEPSSLILALSSYQLAVQWIDSLQTSYALEATQINWSAKFKTIYEGAITTSYKLYKLTGDKSFLELAFNFSEKSRSSSLLEQVKSKNGKFVAGIPDSLLQLGKDLQLDVVFYQEKLAAANETAKIKLYQGYLSQSRLKLASLEEKLELEYPKFYQLKYADDYISIDQVQQELLDQESVLLEYFLGGKSAFVFVIAKETATMFPLKEFEDLNSNISDLLNQVADIESFKRNVKKAFMTYNEKSFALYSQLFTPPLVDIINNKRRLIIVPDGGLNSLPYEALNNEEIQNSEVNFGKLPFLIYTYEFQYSYSAQLLIENKRWNAELAPNTDCLGLAPLYQSTTPIALVGNLDQLRSASGELPGTANEIAQISKYVDGKYFMGEKATESLFKAEANQFGLLHLAMHGEVSLENPNYNHLIFSNKTSEDEEDNLLYQYEIANMDLNAQLVVLSACETGLGKYEKGEGVFSLARSFMYAGVPSVVMSLWRVDDESTSQLMPYFYENLSNGKSKISALHEAKLSYLESADLTFRHPFYWSSFVVIGDGSILKTNNFNFANWAIGAVFLLLILWLIGYRKNTQIRKASV